MALPVSENSIGILFVCTGNICRSPSAEGVFDSFAKVRDLDGYLFTDSAGTHDYHVGHPPDARAVHAASHHGVDLSGLRARQICAEDFALYDMIIAMDAEHRDFLEAMHAQCPGKAAIHLLLDFARDQGVSDVPDPYYQDDRAFSYALRLIVAGANGLLDHIEATMLPGRVTS